MIAKLAGKAAVLLLGGLMLAFGLFPESLAAQVLYLQAGTTTSVQSGQATCEHNVNIVNNNDARGTGSAMESGCTGGRLTVNLVSGQTALPHTVNVSATSQLVVQFQVDTQPGAPDVSLLPVQIAVPVVWKGVLLNDTLVPSSGPLASIGAYTDVNGSLELRKGGAKVSTNNFMGAYHAGISGCLSVPKTEVKAAIMAAKCAAGSFKKEEGNGTIYLSGLIQTGQTYDVVLELAGDLYTLNEEIGPLAPTGPDIGQPELLFGGSLVNQPLGLTWSGPMTISIGTDFQSRIAGLQNQIDQLKSSLDTLRNEFLHHTHTYLTGKGVGQNNTKVSTGPPVIQH